jgi:hypothetical protein
MPNTFYTPKWDKYILNNDNTDISFTTIDIDKYGDDFMGIISQTSSYYTFTSKLICEDINNEYNDYGFIIDKRYFEIILEEHNRKVISKRKRWKDIKNVLFHRKIYRDNKKY